GTCCRLIRTSLWIRCLNSDGQNRPPRRARRCTKENVMDGRDRRQSRVKSMIEFFKRLLRRRPSTPGDPYAYVMAPKQRGPKGRSGAAIADIEDDSFRSFAPRR